MLSQGNLEGKERGLGDGGAARDVRINWKTCVTSYRVAVYSNYPFNKPNT